jgi:ParB-like chromosome segregation protein Spo0J
VARVTREWKERMEAEAAARVDALLEKHPVDHVRWVHVDRVRANDYNPNSVAKTEMQLLATSIRHDGFTQPVVTFHDQSTDMYEIVDGFHRYFCCKTFKDIYDSTGGYIPIVVIDKPINDRMASTIRHNRARGKHSVDGMSSMVFALLQNGWGDEEICNELGMSPEEVIRLKHVTGFSKLFADAEYRKAWKTDRQIRIEKSQREADNGTEPID